MSNHTIWTSYDIAEALNIKINQEFYATGLSIDSRTIKNQEIFLAFKGEVVDGHNYINSAIKNGASCIIISKNIEEKYNVPVVKVDDTFKALYDLAKYNRKRVTAKYYAVTGSVGKTSLKEMLAICLANIGNTYATKGNLNNHIGVPLSLCNMPLDTQYAVLEMGMNHAGEIRPLSVLVNPDVAIISNVEAVHLEFFNSLQGIADAKGEIFEGLKNNGIAILNYDNDFFSYLKNKLFNCNKGFKLASFGFNNKASIFAKDIKANLKESQITASVNGEVIEYKISCGAKHQILNSLAVVAALRNSIDDWKNALKGLASFYGTDGRNKIKKRYKNNIDR